MDIGKQLLTHTELYYKKLKSLCSPFEQLYGVDTVAFFYLSDLNLINIHTHPEWMEYCMEKKYYLDDPHIVYPDNITDGFILSSQVESEPYSSKVHHDALNIFGMHNGVSYVRKIRGGYIALSFNSSKRNPSILSNIINDKTSVDRFSLYLEHEITSILTKLSSKAIDIRELKGENLHNQQGIIPIGPTTNDKVDFYHKINAIKDPDKINSLSEIEVMTLDSLLKGKTIKEISSIMERSHKTIDDVLARLKNKLGCDYKKQLFQNIDIYKSLGIIN